MMRPSLDEFESLAAYRIAYTQYIKERHENGSAAPHHEANHPTVIRCPICDGVAKVATTSTVDDPMWQCMVSPAPGHNIVLEDGEYVGTSFNTDVERSREA